jgi:F-type H+-transporting ATPase subunit b
MLVDWFTTAAQIVNFLILVWLLKRFLYKPILGAMDEREKRMENAFAEAELQKTAAENERAVFERKSLEFEEQKRRLLQAATEQAGEERKKMVAEAREEVDDLKARWRTSIEQEKQTLLNEFSARVGNEVVEISQKLLSDLANVQLEDCITRRFLEELATLTPTKRNQLRSVFAVPVGKPVVARSPFELPESSRMQIRAALQEQFAIVDVQFVVAPELLGGIEISANGHQVSWTIQSYLSSLQQEINQAMEKGELQLARTGA